MSEFPSLSGLLYDLTFFQGLVPHDKGFVIGAFPVVDVVVDVDVGDVDDVDVDVGVDVDVDVAGHHARDLGAVRVFLGI